MNLSTSEKFYVFKEVLEECLDDDKMITSSRTDVLLLHPHPNILLIPL